jgi:hypothetical protein
VRHCVLCGCDLNSTKRSPWHDDCRRDYANLIRRQKAVHSRPEKTLVEHVAYGIKREVEWLLEQPARRLRALGPDAERVLLDVATRMRSLCR